MKKIILFFCLFEYTFSFSALKDFTHEVVYVTDLSSNIDGGQKKGTVFLGHINLIFENKNFDILNLENNELFIKISGHHGEDPSSYSGDYGVTSNIEAPSNTIKVFEFYDKKSFANEDGHILFGLHDLNTIFSASEPAGLF